MSQFHYKASNRAGKIFTGQISADSRSSAARKLRTQGLWVTYLASEDAPSSSLASIDSLSQSFASHSDLGRKDAVLLFRQLHVMLAGGLPLHEAVSVLARQESGGARRVLLQAAEEDLQKGRPFADTLRRFPQAFPPAICELVAVGEASGTLQEILERLADYLSTAYQAGEEMKSAMLYPAILVVCSLCVIILMSLFVLPVFTDLLTSLHADLPLPTQILLGTSSWIAANWPFVIGGLFLLAGVACALYRVETVRLAIDAWRLRAPVFGRLRVYSSWQRLLDTLSVLLESGIRLDRSLEMLSGTTENHYLRQKLHQASKSVQSGQPWWQPLREACPASLLDMAVAGERAGHLPMMLRHAAALCRVIAENQLKRIEAMAQPVAILIIGGIVFGILLSVAMPLLDAMTVVS